jgi:RNA polymerase sigma factor (sigma-70 family)
MNSRRVIEGWNLDGGSSRAKALQPEWSSMETDEVQTGRTSLVLLERYRGGDDAAAQALFARYFERLTLLARSRLSPRLARRTDPEDIVLSVYRSFFIHARAGQFALHRGGDLWRLLAAITKHKLLRQARHHRAECRSADRDLPLEEVDTELFFVRGREPTPEDAVALADELEFVLSRLDPFGRRVLELRMQGAQLSEIAEDTERSERTVRRALGQIRELLSSLRDNA